MQILKKIKFSWGISLHQQCQQSIHIKSSLSKYHDFKFPFKYMNDDLLLPLDQIKRGVVQDMVSYIRENPESEIHYKGIGMMLYHMGKLGIYDALIINRFEQNLFKYKQQFNQRLAFGAFHGFINLNINNFYMQEFLEKEFMRFKDELVIDEVVEMFEAIANNNTLTKAYRHSLIIDVLSPVIMKQYKKTIKYNPGLQLRLFDALIGSSYFEKNLFDLVVEDIVQSKRIRNLDSMLNVLSKLRILKESGKFERDLDTQIKRINERLMGRDDFKWIYNFDQNRYYTIQELVAKRENYSHPEQRIGFYRNNKSVQEDFQLHKDDKLDIDELYLNEAEKDAELKSLMYNKYVQAKMGDVDSKQFVDNDEINQFFKQAGQDGDADEEFEMDDQDLELGASESDEEHEVKEKKLKKKVLKKRKGRQQKQDMDPAILDSDKPELEKY